MLGNRLIKNKKGSMMMDYFIIAAVGILLLGATMMFLNRGQGVVQTIMGKLKDPSESAGQSDPLGSFK